MTDKLATRKKIQIINWMNENGFKQVDIQRELEINNHTQVWETINGKRDDRQVLKWLKDNGCPIEYLNLPADMINQEAA